MKTSVLYRYIPYKMPTLIMQTVHQTYPSLGADATQVYVNNTGVEFIFSSVQTRLNASLHQSCSGAFCKRRYNTMHVGML